MYVSSFLLTICYYIIFLSPLEWNIQYATLLFSLSKRSKRASCSSPGSVADELITDHWFALISPPFLNTIYISLSSWFSEFLSNCLKCTPDACNLNLRLDWSFYRATLIRASHYFANVKIFQELSCFQSVFELVV